MAIPVQVINYFTITRFENVLTKKMFWYVRKNHVEK